MQLTKLLMIVCVFGLLVGAKKVNESLIVLRAAELVQRNHKTGVAPGKSEVRSLGEAFLVTALGVAGVADPRAVDAVAQAVKSEMLFGCGLVAASFLALCVVVFLHFYPRWHSAQASARSRRRRRSP